jgi:hypothetical protein
MSKKKSSVKKTAKKGVAQRAKDVGRKKAKATRKSSGQPGLPGKHPRDTNGAADPQRFQVPPVQIGPPDSEIQ